MERSSVVFEAVVGLAVSAALVSEAVVWWSGGSSDSGEVALWRKNSAVARWPFNLIDDSEGGPVLSPPAEWFIHAILLLGFIVIGYIYRLEETYRCQVGSPTLESSPESQTTLLTTPLTTPLTTALPCPLQIIRTKNFTLKKRELAKIFIDLLGEYKPQIDEKIYSLRRIADEMQGINKDVAIAKITGNSAGIVGGICTIVGFALIPVSFGTSTILSGIGIGIGVAGGATNIGAVISKGAMFKKRLNIAKNITDDINTQMEELYGALISLEEFVGSCPENDLGQLETNIGADIIRVIPCMQGLGTNIAKIMVGEGVEAAGKAAPKIFQAVGGAVFAGAFVIWDIVNIVNNSKELGVNYQPEAGKMIRDMASSMERYLGNLETLQESLKEI